MSNRFIEGVELDSVGKRKGIFFSLQDFGVFLMWPIFKILTEFVTIILQFYDLVFWP